MTSYLYTSLTLNPLMPGGNKMLPPGIKGLILW